MSGLDPIFFAAREAAGAQVFGRRHPRWQPRAAAHEIAVGWGRRVPLYGDLAWGGKVCEQVILHR